jgi:hypothetical protein
VSAGTARSRGALTACCVLLLASLAACGGSDYPFADDCAPRIRYQAEVYRDVGFSSRAVRRAGVAEVVTCPRDGATRTTVWSYPGRDPHDVVAVHLHGRVYQVMVAERLPSAYVDGLHAAGLLNAGTD